MPGRIQRPTGSLKHGLCSLRKKSCICFKWVHSCRQGRISFHPPLPDLCSTSRIAPACLIPFFIKQGFISHFNSLFSLVKGGEKAFLVKKKNNEYSQRRVRQSAGSHRAAHERSVRACLCAWVCVHTGLAFRCVSTSQAPQKLWGMFCMHI